MAAARSTKAAMPSTNITMNGKDCMIMPAGVVPVLASLTSSIADYMVGNNPYTPWMSKTSFLSAAALTSSAVKPEIENKTKKGFLLVMPR